jgi:hypothetical protein
VDLDGGSPTTSAQEIWRDVGPRLAHALKMIEEYVA